MTLSDEIERLDGSYVTDAEIDALVASGWDWWCAYRHLQSAAHAAASIRARTEEKGHG